MQVNENVGQVPQVKRILDADEASIATRAMLDTRADRPGAGAPRSGARKKLEVAVGPRHRFGAGF